VLGLVQQRVVLVVLQLVARPQEARPPVVQHLAEVHPVEVRQVVVHQVEQALAGHPQVGQDLVRQAQLRNPERWQRLVR
jgi:hypothetical protein